MCRLLVTKTFISFWLANYSPKLYVFFGWVFTHVLFLQFYYDLIKVVSYRYLGTFISCSFVEKLNCYQPILSILIITNNISFIFLFVCSSPHVIVTGWRWCRIPWYRCQEIQHISTPIISPPLWRWKLLGNQWMPNSIVSPTSFPSEFSN